MAGDEDRGLIDNVLDNLTDKKKVGFDPDVCVGCPMRVLSKADVTDEMDRKVKMMPERALQSSMPCGLCGCPTMKGGMLDRSGRPPGGCLRIGEHERRGDSNW